MTWDEFRQQVRSNGWSTVVYTPSAPDSPIEVYTGTAVGKRWVDGQVSDVDHTALHADRSVRQTRDARRQAIVAAVTRLGQISAGAETATNAQLKTAIGDLAAILERLIRDQYRED